VACGKLRYASAEEAWKVIRRKALRRRDGDKRRPSLGVYRCHVCRAWHIRTNTDHIARRRSWGWRKQKEHENGDEPGA
jgi:hypothetical protein